MNPEQLYIDSVSGKFMDGVSPRPIENPTFFSNETRYIKCNVLTVRNNTATPREHGKNSTYFMRLGTTALKLADGIDPTTASPVLITAKASVVTAASSAATGTASVITYAPVTASFVASITTLSSVTATFSSSIFYIPPVTATVTASITTATFSTQTYKKIIQVDKAVSDLRVYGHPLVGEFYYEPVVLTFSPVFTSATSASLIATMELDTVTSSYQIKSITMSNRGKGYPNGTYDVIFTSTTSSDVQAIATAAASNGYIRSITISCRGIYTSATPPTATILLPEPTIVGVKINSEINNGWSKNGNISVTSTFRWALGQTGVSAAKADIIFTSPDATGTTLPISEPIANIEFVKNEKNGGQYYGLWKINWLQDGYGYATTPSISHSPVTVSNCKIARYYSSGEKSSNALNTENINWDRGVVDTRPAPQPATVTLFYYGEQMSPSLAEELNEYIKLEAGPLGFVGKPSIQYASPFTDPKLLSNKPYKNPNYNELFEDRGRQLGAGGYEGYGIPTYVSRATAYSENEKLNEIWKAPFSSGRSLSGAGKYLSLPPNVQLGVNPPTDLGIPYPVDFLSATGKFIDTRFGAQIEFGGVAPLFYQIDPIGKIESTDGSGKTTFILYGDQFETIVGKESFYTNRVEYLTINGTVDSNGRQFLATLNTPDINKNWKLRLASGSGREIYSGGVFDAEFSIIDFGKNYTSVTSEDSMVVFRKNTLLGSNQGKAKFQNVYGLLNNPLFNSSSTIGITIPTGTLFKKTILSKEAKTGKRFEGGGIQYFVADSGLGYTDDIEVTITVTAPITSGLLKSVSLTNTPAAYMDGFYDCIVQSPTTGSTAKVKILFDSTNQINGQLFIEDSGYGYTTPPTITVTAPNLNPNGFLRNISLSNSPQGYSSSGKQYDLIISPSPVTGGNASGYFKTYKITRYTTSYYADSSSDPAYNKKVVLSSTIKENFKNYNLSGAGIDPAKIPNISLKPANNIIETFQIGDAPISSSKLSSTKVVYFGKYKDAKARLLYDANSKPRPVGLYSETGINLNEITRTIPIEQIKNNIPSFTELSNGFYLSTYANVFVKIEEIEYVETFITSTGYGYSTPPTITAPAPDSLDYGKVTNIVLTNKPNGYLPNLSYSLTFSSSPTAGGDAEGFFTVQNNGSIVATVLTSGIGYVTPPTITAQGPNAIQGYLANPIVTTQGIGYSEGEYQCSVTTAPSGGETAQVSFVVNGNSPGKFILLNSGKGYVTAPIITVPTPSGNIISSITITCGGSYYDNEDAIFTLSDATGQGCGLGSAVISSGKIMSISVLNRGYNYSDNPVLEFNPPMPDAPTPLELSEVEGKFNITVASADAILGNLSTKEINLEIYETDGVEQQVVVQGKVNLNKRVA